MILSAMLRIEYKCKEWKQGHHLSSYCCSGIGKMTAHSTVTAVKMMRNRFGTYFKGISMRISHG